jgi:hypothetical protein
MLFSKSAAKVQLFFDLAKFLSKKNTKNVFLVFFALFFEKYLVVSIIFFYFNIIHSNCKNSYSREFVRKYIQPYLFVF